MTFSVQPPRVRADATALVIFRGTADTFVSWALDGPGAIEPLSQYTDHNGQAAARFTPVTAGDVVTITVTTVL